MYYHECPYCGCYMDPGERCDCQDTEARNRRKRKEINRRIEEMEVSGWTQEELEICC